MIMIINECCLPEDAGAAAATLSFFVLTAWHLALKEFVAIVAMRRLEPDPSIASLILQRLVQSRFSRKLHEYNFNVGFSRVSDVSAEALLDMIVLLKFLFRSTGGSSVGGEHNTHLRKSCMMDFYSILQLPSIDFGTK